jgi:carbon-monoxide dehydrogenase small subunit
MSIDLTLNDEPTSFTGDPRMALLDYLRDGCGLTGTKAVCREGFCGACTVHVDGQPVPSCLRPMGLLTGAKVVTVEGMAPFGSLNPVQKAFIAHDVVQCGMCFPGMVMTLTHYLGTTNAPTRDGVKAAMVGNICRCTGYEQIIEAVLSVGHAGGTP